jgi:hypothetical protein
MDVQSDPRLGPDTERSGVLTIGPSRLARAVRAEEVLEVSVDKDGTRALVSREATSFVLRTAHTPCAARKPR